MHIFLGFFALREVSLHRKTGGSEFRRASVRKARTGCFFFAIHSGDLIYADSGLAGGTRPGRSTACACGLISFKLLRDVRVAVRAVFVLAVTPFRHLQRVRDVAYEHLKCNH